MYLTHVDTAGPWIFTFTAVLQWYEYSLPSMGKAHCLEKRALLDALV